ncbi:peptidoglycan editing factor PgeF [Alkalihalobacillus sp. 1P02AB]|uniref:peptidoglycan editing factor PgeF n=1 Tax=Alkalihalobacillus sp. 1P02AB TaxID=3132260 RepID=UPI0039A6D896
MTEPFIQKNEQLLLIEPYTQSDSNLIAGFTTRNGGVSTGHFHSLNMGFHVPDKEDNVIKNRKMIAEKLDFPTEFWVGSEQVHEATIQKVTKNDCSKGALSFDSALKNTDGLYTADANVLLTSLYADCVPLYFWSEKRRLVGLAHAGWKGTVLGIGEKMIQRWVEDEEVAITDIHVAIGPCISQAAYEVDSSVIEKITEHFGQKRMEEVTIQTDKEHYQLDLRLLNFFNLIDQGLKKEQILVSTYCTLNDESLFFSHRRDNGKTGRLMSFIGRKSE